MDTLSCKWEAWIADSRNCRFSATGPRASDAFMSRHAVEENGGFSTEIVAENKSSVALVFGESREESDVMAQQIVDLHNKLLEH